MPPDSFDMGLDLDQAQVHGPDTRHGRFAKNPFLSQNLLRLDIIGVNCHSSKNLLTWTHEGIVLPGEETDMTHDLHKSNVLERPIVIFNDKTDECVTWMHIDVANYLKPQLEWLSYRTLHKLVSLSCDFESRDMTIFTDDDGKTYIIFSS